MALTTRHFNALMKKNWITQKKQPCSSFCSLFCPGFLMLLLVYIRTLIKPEEEGSAQLLQSQRPFFPVSWLPDDFPDTEKTDDSVNNFFLYDTYVNTTYSVQNDIQGPLAFAPVNCFLNSSFTAPKVAAPIIGIIGDSTVTTGVQDYLTKLLNFQAAAGQGFFIIKNYATEQDMFDYISSETYLINDDVGVCMGIQITNSSASSYQISLYFDDQTGFGGITGVGIPSTSNPAWSYSVAAPNKGAYFQYSQDGFSYMQNLIANIILRTTTGVDDAQITFMSVPVPSNATQIDSFGQILSGVLPLFLVLIYLLPVYNTVFLIVQEKESRTKESCRMMGMTDLPYWLSWFVYYTIQNTIISLISWGILCINVIENSSKLYVLLYFWLFGESIFGQIVFLQSFFQKSKYAGITASVVYFGFLFFNFPVQNATVSYTKKLMASIIPQVANSQMAVVFAGYETTGVGLDSTTAHQLYDNYKFSGGLWMLLAGLIVFTLFGFYLDAILPKEYGSRSHPCFCFKKSSYDGCCKKSSNESEVQDEETRESMLQGNSDGEMETAFLKKENYEPVAQEIIRLESTGNFLRIEGLQKKYDDGNLAVKGINVKMYQNQIFALLGQNGAGKTTTISMLTGLIQKSAGTAKVYNIDMFKNFDLVRKFMGICPQHDVLFDYLSPIEHLQVFYDFKGGDPGKKEKEIADLIRDVGLTDDMNKMASSLSGGNKRKLSVAIALCGGSKLVLLDEPTAGMDLGARRGLWDMLKNYRRDKIIILTTHYMDEADVLGDRIGIMKQGEMQCLGSSLFLKNRFGAGYKLTMVKKSKDKNNVIGPYLKQTFGEQIELQSEVASEIAFQIPSKEVIKFKNFFSTFDNEMHKYGIESYGISITTLEEVFLKINKEFKMNLANSEYDKEGKESGSAFETEIMNTDELMKETEFKNSMRSSINRRDDEEIVKEQAPERLVGNSGIVENINALLTKRFNIYKRDRTGLCCEVIVPFVCVVVGCLLSFYNFNPTSPAQAIVPSLYPSPQRIIMNNQNVVPSASQFTSQDFYNNLPGGSDFWQVTYNTMSSATNISDFYAAVYAARLEGVAEPYRYGSFQIYEADQAKQKYSVNVFMNLTSQDVAGYFPQYIYQSVLATATGIPNFEFQMTTVPYPTLFVLKQRGSATIAFDFSYMVTIAIALIPCVMIAFIVKEREESLKHMQLISGMNLPAYWISNMIADLIKVYIPMLLIIATYYIFNIKLPGVWVLFLIYPLAIVPFTYLTSFLFTTDSKAQILTILVTYAAGNVIAFVIFFLQLIPQTMKVGDILRWVFCIFPSYTLVNGILWSSCGTLVLQVRQSDVDAYPQLPTELWAWKNLGGDAAILIGHFMIDTLLLCLIELDVFKCFNGCSMKKITARDTTLNLDEDVVQEEVRVAQNTTDVIRVHDFRKAYTSLLGEPFLAVERISFGLDYGECFALLGVNGAGKSTTFKSLTAETVPSQGKITIAGFDITQEFPQARQLIGYCPQKDAIFPLMSVEEHLWFYAKIKGIPVRMQGEIIEQTILEMSLTEHRHKPAGTLSGGNKRKLSVAMAIIGNPPIILLDEPSAGMDPEARRFMWSVVANISQRDKKSAVILTTHSMEEAEALSTKMGIMVRGGIFRCYGSSQHIKNKYGTGYECQIKIRKPKEDELVYILKNMNLQFEDIMSKVKLQDAKKKALESGVDDLIIGQIQEKGIGSDLALEAIQCDGNVRLKNLATYIYIQQYGIKVITLFAQLFSQVELMEQCSDFFNLRFAKEGKTIGYVFGKIEDHKVELNISEYSVFQTTLEQIFQTFANMTTKDDKAAFAFRMNELDQLQLLNQDRRSTLGQVRLSQTGLRTTNQVSNDAPEGIWHQKK